MTRIGARQLHSARSPHRSAARHATLATLAALAAGLVIGASPVGARAQTALASTTEATAGTLVPPPVPREFRGVWVASVSNIDWPSRKGLPVADQKRELIEILDRAALLKLNAVVLQVRPSADALYDSPHEPWSEYLTGVQGRAPEPYYDPLAFAVEEAHARGLELHAWFNPYRARHPAETSAVSPKHISRKSPGLVRRYGPFLWMDPGDARVREITTRVILDVVKRYDIDGVHIDDYFYPYRIDRPGRARGYLPFPDDATWRRYRRSGGKLSRDDWRRRNVDLLVEQLYAGVKRTKPWVKFGVSPFGIWRPGHPDGVRGLDAYQELFADSRKWLRNGWLDYVSPQLYWRSDAPQQSYTDLLGWWVSQNAKGRHVWPGNYTSRVGGTGSAPWPTSEVEEQIRLTRAQPGASGNVHFSMRVFLENRDSIADRLVAESYREPALVPASPWLARAKLPPPYAQLRADTATGRTVLTLEPAAETSARVRLWVVQAHDGERWTTRIVPGAERSVVLVGDDASSPPEHVFVRAVDRVGNESVPVEASRDAPAVEMGSRRDHPAPGDGRRSFPGPR